MAEQAKRLVVALLVTKLMGSLVIAQAFLFLGFQLINYDGGIIIIIIMREGI